MYPLTPSPSELIPERQESLHSAAASTNRNVGGSFISDATLQFASLRQAHNDIRIQRREGHYETKGKDQRTTGAPGCFASSRLARQFSRGEGIYSFLHKGSISSELKSSESFAMGDQTLREVVTLTQNDFPCDVILRLGDRMSLHPVQIQIASTVTHLSTPSRSYAS